MKLSKINTIGLLPSQLRIIFNDQSQLAESVVQRSKSQNFLPLSYLFIESVIATRSLSEAELGRLGSLVQAGMAKLNSAMTPGSGKDLDLLLQFMAPRGGGAKAVTNLIQAASQEQGDIQDNEQWWQELFNAFGVNEQEIKNNVQSQVRQEISQPAAETPEAPAVPIGDAPPTEPAAEPAAEPEPAAPAQASAPAQAPAPAQALGQPALGQPAPNGGLLNTLRQERGAEQDYQADIAQKLDTIRRQRGDTQAAIGHLQNRLEKALQKQGGEAAVESISDETALILMNEASVINNIGTIVNHMIRNIGIKCRCRTPVLSEAGLLSRLGGAVKSGRNMITNPQIKQRLGAATSSANNTRAAKLATQLLADQIRTTFKLKLDSKGLTPEAITNKLKVWTNLKELEKQSGGNPSPKLVNAMLKASQELKDVFKLFQHGNMKSEFDYSAPNNRKQNLRKAADKNALNALNALNAQNAQNAQSKSIMGTKTKRDRAIFRALELATGGPSADRNTAANYNPANEQKYINSMVEDNAWAKLMKGKNMLSAVKKEFARHSGLQQKYNESKNRKKIRAEILKRVFNRIQN